VPSARKPELHARGVAHSVEAYADGALVGGLYGVALGGAFMGESMFHHATDASKVCFAHLVERLRARGFVILDTQFMTEHLASLGAVYVSAAQYLRILRHALRLPCRFDP
jgi:leucyl/phenylalanyl-tRNA--protein transferase